MNHGTPPKIPAARPLFLDEDIPKVLEQIGDVLRSGQLILGPRTKELETEFARRVGTKHAVALSSCTAALEIAFRHLGVEGRQVIIPANTFVSTVNAALNAGAEIVFCDMHPDDFCLDVDDAVKRITDRTAALVVVHLAGFVPRDFDRLRSTCRAKKIALVEDCAHAHGASITGEAVGSLGHIGCFSFYATKIMTSGVGGMLTTDDDDAAELARSLRHHGQGSSLEDIVQSGNDWLLDEVRAVLALSQLARLDEMIAERRTIAARYDELLAKLPNVRAPRPAPETVPVYYKYPVLLPLGTNRDHVKNELLDKHGIETGSLYSPPAHLMPIFRKRLGTEPGRLPAAEAMLGRQLCLPMHAAMQTGDADRVIAALTDVLR
jgi:dTDP-4-amino-4,6-dideoxygalactose transaminase